MALSVKTPRADKPVGRGKREQFRDQVAKQNDDGEDDGRRRAIAGTRAASGPSQIRKRQRTTSGTLTSTSAEQEDVEDAARILAKDADEFLERRMFLLEPPELMGLEGEERGLQSGEKRRPEDQDRDDEKEKDESRPASWSRCGGEVEQPFALAKTEASSFAHHLRRPQVKAFMSKGERISRFVESLDGGRTGRGRATASRRIPITGRFFGAGTSSVTTKRTMFWNRSGSGKRSPPEDAQYFKGLIQAAGAFVHLQKHFEHPTHPKHGRRLAPAVRLFRLAEKNLAPFGAGAARASMSIVSRNARRGIAAAVDAEPGKNPWTPESAPKFLSCSRFAVRSVERRGSVGENRLTSHRRRYRALGRVARAPTADDASQRPYVKDQLAPGEHQHRRENERNRAHRETPAAEIRAKRSSDHRGDRENPGEVWHGTAARNVTDQARDRIDQDEQRRNRRGAAESRPSAQNRSSGVRKIPPPVPVRPERKPIPAPVPMRQWHRRRRGVGRIALPEKQTRGRKQEDGADQDFEKMGRDRKVAAEIRCGDGKQRERPEESPRKIAGPPELK